jgi:hypothetical protein
MGTPSIASVGPSSVLGAAGAVVGGFVPDVCGGGAGCAVGGWDGFAGGWAGFALRAPGCGNGGNAWGGCCCAAAIARSSAITFIVNNYTMRSAA